MSDVSPDFLSKILKKANHLSSNQQTQYVSFMLKLIGKALVSASQHDAMIRRELQGYPVGFTICMQVLPNVMGFCLQVNAKQRFQWVNIEKADVVVNFKHVAVAFLVLTFQESTAQAFANDRATVDGDLAYAIRFVRILNRLQVLILPKAIAVKAVKRYPKLPLKDKMITSAKIYADVGKMMFI